MLFVAWSGLFYLGVQITDEVRSLYVGSSTITIIRDLNSNCPSQETEETSTSTRPIENVVLITKDLQERNKKVLDGTTVKNR